MSQWKNNTTIEQAQKQPIEKEVHPWILGNQITNLKMESQSVSIAKNMDT